MFNLQTDTNPPQMLADDSPRPRQEEIKKTSTAMFLFFCYLYFVQGTIMGVVGTIPYVYSSLPDVHTMTIFNSVGVPYSFKFLIAPFLERFSYLEYGKRKTWIMLSQILTGSLLFLSSFYTSLEQARILAWLSMAMTTGMLLQNIALHSLIVKEITCANKSSMIQSFAEVFGILIGGLVLLKFTSIDFAHKIGLESPITTIKIVLFYFGCFILAPLPIIHFQFKQKVLESERTSTRYSLCKILSHYSAFLDTSSKYFRFCVFALIFQQGLNFFNSLYDYELVKAGFSRDTYNTISNIIIIPILFITFFLKRLTAFVGGHFYALLVSTLSSTLLFAYFLYLFPLNPWVISIWYFFATFMDSWRFFIFGVMVNQFPLHGLSGMYITLLGSFCNFGRLTSLHTQICSFFGWREVSLLGLSLQLMILCCFKRIYRWLQAGDSKIPEEFTQKQAEGLKSQHLQLKQKPIK